MAILVALLCIGSIQVDQKAFAEYDYVVTFNTLGQDETPSDQYINPSMPKVATVDVESDTYQFEGWYTGKDYTKKWDFINDDVIEDMTLYAKWSLNGKQVVAEPIHITASASGDMDTLGWQTIYSSILKRYVLYMSGLNMLIDDTNKAIIIDCDVIMNLNYNSVNNININNSADMSTAIFTTSSIEFIGEGTLNLNATSISDNSYGILIENHMDTSAYEYGIRIPENRPDLKLNINSISESFNAYGIKIDNFKPENYYASRLKLMSGTTTIKVDGKMENQTIDVSSFFKGDNMVTKCADEIGEYNDNAYINENSNYNPIKILLYKDEDFTNPATNIKVANAYKVTYMDSNELIESPADDYYFDGQIPTFPVLTEAGYDFGGWVF